MFGFDLNNLLMLKKYLYLPKQQNIYKKCGKTKCGLAWLVVA